MLSLRKQTYKIAIVGAECSGKTSLLLELKKQWNMYTVSEYARFYLNHHPKEDSLESFWYMFEGQISWEKKALEDVALWQTFVSSPQRSAFSSSFFHLPHCSLPVIVHDTDILVYIIWAKYVYQKDFPRLWQFWHAYAPDLYILTDPSIPYEQDPIRYFGAYPEKRQEVHKYYIEILNALSIPWILVQGEVENRSLEIMYYLDSRVKS